MTLKAETSHTNWLEINSVEEWEDILDKSNSKPQLVFKHSIRCGISKHALFNFEKDWSFNPKEVDVYYLDLINHRDISNKIANDLDITHQSPQAILIKNKEAIYYPSHQAIDAKKINEKI